MARCSDWPFFCEMKESVAMFYKKFVPQSEGDSPIAFVVICEKQDGFYELQIVYTDIIRAAAVYDLVKSQICLQSSIELRDDPLQSVSLPVIGVELVDKELRLRFVSLDKVFSIVNQLYRLEVITVDLCDDIVGEVRRYFSGLETDKHKDEVAGVRESLSGDAVRDGSLSASINEDSLLLSVCETDDSAIALDNETERSQKALLSSLRAPQGLRRDLREVLWFGGFTSGAVVSVVISNFVITKFLSQLDPEHLAANSIISSMQNFVLYAPSDILCSVCILICNRQSNPDADKSEIGNVVRESWLMSTLICIPTTALTLFSKSLLTLVKQNPQIAALSQQYFRAAAIGMPAYFIVACNVQISMGLQKPQVFFITILGQQLLGLALSYPLMFGVESLNIPKLGIVGWGYASAIANWLTFTASMAHIFWISWKNPKFQIWNFRNHRRALKIIKEMVSLGLPIAIKVGTDLCSVQLLVMLTGWLGNDALISYGIATSYLSFATLPAPNLGQASGVLVRKAVISGSISRAKRIANINCLIGLAIPAVAGVLFLSIPDRLISFFMPAVNSSDSAFTSDDQRQISITTTHLLWLTAGGAIDSLRAVYEGSLRGFEDTSFAMWTGLINNILIAVTTAYVLGIPAGVGVTGVFGARLLGMFGCATSLAARWLYQVNAPQEQKPSCFRWLGDFFRCRRTTTSVQVSEQAAAHSPTEVETGVTSTISPPWYSGVFNFWSGRRSRVAGLFSSSRREYVTIK